MTNDAYILKHYKRIAEGFGHSSLCTIQDPAIREAEVTFFKKQISLLIEVMGITNPTILDLGCGNGYTLSILREFFPDAKLIGVEFTPELYELAQNRELDNCEIYQGDIRKSLPDIGKVDFVITERVIINLLSWKQQRAAFDNIYEVLNDGAFYLMSESFREPWVQMNLARREVGLADIPESKHNRYLSENAVEALEKMGFKEISGCLEKNHLSTHFYISRVFHQAFRSKGSKIKSARMVDFFCEALPPSVGNYSPILFRAFKKVTS
jgi:SAM-dependent methyltransferase